MSDDKGKYVTVWRKWIPVIRLKLKQALVSSQQFQLDEIEFKIPGRRIESGYAFNLEINKGVVTNNISGTVVARTLAEVLKEDRGCRELLNLHRVRIKLDSRFLLQLEILKEVPRSAERAST